MPQPDSPAHPEPFRLANLEIRPAESGWADDTRRRGADDPDRAQGDQVP